MHNLINTAPFIGGFSLKQFYNAPERQQNLNNMNATAENNSKNLKLVHEFMGQPFGLTEPLIPYNSDWNWLMPVVENIENTQPISITISCGNCEVYNCERAETLFFFEGDKIEAVYNACVAVIEWYNEQK